MKGFFLSEAGTHPHSTHTHTNRENALVDARQVQVLHPPPLPPLGEHLVSSKKQAALAEGPADLLFVSLSGVTLVTWPHQAHEAHLKAHRELEE